MCIVHKVSCSVSTFVDVAESVFSMVLNEGRICSRIEIVFDVYRELSIKSAKRQLRGSDESLHYINLTAGQKVQQQRKFLTNEKNKTALIDFLVTEWKSNQYVARLGFKSIIYWFQRHVYQDCSVRY